MLRSDKEVKERDYKKYIFLQASEIDSTLPRKMRRTDLGMPSSEADNESLPPKHLSFTPEAARPAATTGNCAEKSRLDFQRQEIEENVQILKEQVASAKDDLEKLNCESRHFQSLSEIRGHTKVKCSKAPCTDINACKIKEKHPEHKAKISQLQREIRSLETRPKKRKPTSKVLQGFVFLRNET